MQGRSLLIISIMVISVLARAQDEFKEFGEENPAALSPVPSEPDPNSVLNPKSSRSGSHELSEFEESGGETPKPAPPPAAPAAPATPATPPPTAENPPAEAPKSDAPSVTPSPAPDTSTPPPSNASKPPAEKPAEVEPMPEITVPVPAAPTTTAEQEKTLPARKNVEAPAHKSRPLRMAKQGNAVPTDDPDIKAEEKFHRLYQMYNQLPTPPESWDKAGAGAPQIYGVQRGDTLWDISQTLFGDPYFWPKIWSLNNDQVLNPHEISPEMKIRFFHGSISELPAVAISTPQPPVVVAEPPLAKAEPPPTTDHSKMPPPFRKSRRLKKVPDSLPLYRFGLVNVPKPNVEIESLFKPLPNPKADLTHYVHEGDFVSEGEVTEIETGMKSAAEFQYVDVEINDPSQKHFYVVKDVEKVTNPFTVFGSSGRMIEVQGELEILEKLPDEERHYRAIVRKAISPIEVGAELLPGSIPKVDVTPTAVTQGSQGTLIGGELSGSRTLYPKLSLVFLDIGSSAGLSVGQTLNVFANFKNRNPENRLKVRSRPIGAVKIVKVTPNFSTAYVTEAEQDLQIGDFVGGGSPAVAESSAPAPSEANSSSDGGDLDL